MNALYVCEICEGLPLPGFGPAFEAHIQSKRHPGVRNASLTAWNLLAYALRAQGIECLPELRFEDRGRPVFVNLPLHFSLSHSAGMAAVLLSDAPCGVDIERVRPDMADRLMERCLSAHERQAGMDFFTAWTCKECLGKLSGQGIGARPAQVDSLSDAYAALHFFTETIFDRTGREYRLSAVTGMPADLDIQRITI